MLYLSNCLTGDKVIVAGFKSEMPQNIKKRLCQLGIFSGTEIIFVQKSILKKVILIEVNFYMLSIRFDIASMIEVKHA